jgi:hypothetical protein
MGVIEHASAHLPSRELLASRRACHRCRTPFRGDSEASTTVLSQNEKMLNTLLYKIETS